MRRRVLIRIAATFVLVTCLGHIVGTFMPVPAEETAMQATMESMKATMVPMPVGVARSYMQIFDGNNLCTSLFLLLCSLQLLSVSNVPGNPTTNRVILIVALGLTGFATISVVYFFPLPAVFTAVAAALSFFARART